jgi:predicted permease
MWKDLLFGFRALRRSPALTTAAVLSLALGIGANTAIFSLLDQVVLRSLPVADPERLVALHGIYSGPGESSSSWGTNSESVFPYPFYRALRDRDPAFSGMLACAFTSVSIAWRSDTQVGQAEMVSGNYFTTLGVPTVLGRPIVPDDDGSPGAHPVAVLSHPYWATRFGGDPAILNRTIAINGQPFVVVGVASANFNGLVQGDSPNVFVPIAMQHAIAPAMTPMEDPTFSWLTFFARLKPGESMAHAQAATDVVFHALLQADINQSRVAPDPKEREAILKNRLELRPAARGIAELREKWEKPLTVLMVMVALVLLIACANVAGLLVARATGRQREIAIRLALGANRWTLVRQLLAEGLLLAIGGAIAGLLLARWSTAAILRILPRDTAGSWIDNSLDLRMLGYTLAVCVICALLFAVVPALQSIRPEMAGTLKDQATNVLSRGSTARLRRLLVTAQVALSLVLAVGAGLFSVSAAKLIDADRGFRTERLSMFSADATLIRSGQAASSAFYRDLLQRLTALPGQSGVAASDSGPYGDAGFGMGAAVEGYQGFATTTTAEAITPGYFRTLRIPLRAGREFNERDMSGAKAVVIDGAFAKRYFANRNPIGMHLALGNPNAKVLDREIVGIAADVRTNVRRASFGTVYFPYTQRDQPASMAFYVRGTGSQDRLATAIRQTVREADAGLPVPEVKPIELKIRESLYTNRLVAALSLAFGILATSLAAIGLYGVIAYAVARRTGEIGVRMALGALPGDVIRMVLLDAAQMVAAGIVVGSVAAFALGRYVESQLYGIHAANAATYGIAACVLIVVAGVAAFVPARRAARIDPLSALRYE